MADSRAVRLAPVIEMAERAEREAARQLAHCQGLLGKAEAQLGELERYRADYQSANVPMLAVVRGRTVVGLQVVLYAWATVVCSLLLIPVANMGLLYTLVALLTGVWFIIESHRL